MAQAQHGNLEATLEARLAPFDALDACHQDMIAHLQLLDRLVRHLDRQGVDDEARRLAVAVMRFFAETAQAHHAEEEHKVFPALLHGNDPEMIQHVQRLQQDHGWLEEDWRELALQLSAVADGYSWYNIETLRDGAELFAALYHDHITLEESLVYPEARRVVKAECDGIGRRLSEQRRAA